MISSSNYYVSKWMMRQLAKTRITELLKAFDYPIFQGGMVWVGGWWLRLVQTKAGGLGIIGSGNAPKRSGYTSIKSNHLRTNLLVLTSCSCHLQKTRWSVDWRRGHRQLAAGNPVNTWLVSWWWNTDICCSALFWQNVWKITDESLLHEI